MGRQQFTSEFKAKVAIAAIKGDATLSELSSEYGVHTTQINEWKKQLLEAGRQAFNKKGQQKAQEQAASEKERLYAQIGQLKVELDWLKKKTGHLS